MSQSTPPRRQASQGSRRSAFSSPVERKTALRNALNEVNNLQRQGSPGALDDLTDMISKVDEIHEDYENSELEQRIEHADQILIDSEVMAVSSQVIKGCMNSMSKKISAYNKSEFAQKLKEYVKRQAEETPAADEDQSEINWANVENEIVNLFLRVPNSSMLLSSLNPVVKPEKNKTILDKTVERRLARQKDAKATLKKPENVTQLEKEETSVEQSVHRLLHRVKQTFKSQNQQAILFFKLVLHPRDFGKSIENILHTAFLARDGRLRMIIGEEGDLLVIPTSIREKEEAEQAGNNINIQNMMSINYDQWEFLVQHYNITEPMIDF